MKLFEQDWSKINLDDIPTDGTVIVKQTVVPKPKVGGDIKPKVGDDIKPKVGDDIKPKVDDKTKKELRVKTFSLIQNAVQFYVNISKLGNSRNWDEERMQQIFVTHSMTSRNGLNVMDMVKYCDMLYRIIFDMQSVRKANSAAYEYWLSRNYGAPTSWQFLESISLPEFKSYESWFMGDHFADMDWEDGDNMRYFKKIFANISPQRLQQLTDNPNTAKLTLKSKFSNKEIHDMVMNAYKTKLWGEPGKRKMPKQK